MLARRYLSLAAVAVLAAGFSISVSIAEETDAADAARPDELVKQLDAPRFNDRKAAEKKLAAMGAKAIPALTKAALEGSQQVTSTAVELLAKFHATGEDATKAAAKEALKKLAASERPAVARRAQNVIDPPKARPAPGGIRIGGARIQLRVVAGGNQKIKTSIVNGVKTIEAEENGKKTKIVEDPNGGIEVTITETKDGKAQTKTYKAKNAKDLEKKHPEAHKAYKKYSAGGGIQIRQIQIGPGRAIPLPIQPGRIQPGNIRQFRRPFKIIDQDTQDRVEKAREQLKQITEKLEKLTKDLQQADKEVKKLLDELKGLHEKFELPARPNFRRAAVRPRAAQPAEKKD